MSEITDKAWMQITSGQGPKECAWVVAQVYKKILLEAVHNQLRVNTVEVLAFDKHLRHQQLLEIDAYRSILLRIDGAKLRAFCKAWEGTICWQGQSIYRLKHKRKNWFVGVKILPAILDEAIQIASLKKEIEIDAMRASGPGGQHVNKTNSAVRIRHQPTNLGVKVSSHRSQHKNKSIAIERLILLLQQSNNKDKASYEYNRWLSHYQLERGNAKRTFSGKNFKEI